MDLDHDTSTKVQNQQISTINLFYKGGRVRREAGQQKESIQNWTKHEKMQDPGTQKGIAGWRKPDKLAKATIYHKNKWEMPRASKEWHLGY